MPIPVKVVVDRAAGAAIFEIGAAAQEHNTPCVYVFDVLHHAFVERLFGVLYAERLCEDVICALVADLITELRKLRI